MVLKACGRTFITEAEAEEEAYREAGLLPPKKDKSQVVINGVVLPDVSEDWTHLDRQLFQNFYITPKEIDEMTLPEIAAIAKDDKQETTMLPDTMTAADFINSPQVTRYHKLKPQQKLKMMFRKYQL